MKNKWTPFLVASAMIMAALSAQVAGAAIVTYTIDPSLSSLTIEVLFSGLTLDGQGVVVGDPADPSNIPAADAGSKTAAYGGTLTADKVGSTLTFTGGSLLDALLNPNAEFIPTEGDAVTPDGIPVGSPDGLYTAGEDNYGFQLNAGAFGHGYATLRDVALDITEGSASFGGSTAALGFKVSSGYLSVLGFGGLVGGATGEDTVVSDPGDPAALNAGGLLGQSIVGLTETIRVPVLLDLGDFVISGEIVASRAIPEPSSFLLLGGGLMGLIAVRRRQK